MTFTPAELITTATSFEKTSNPMVLKPTFGAVGSQYVEFKQIEEYDANKSALADREVKSPVEICLIQNDRFTKVPIRVNDLSNKQKVELAPLYERFKSQKDSKETNVLGWDAISDLEKGLLMQVGVGSVEQLASFSDEQIYRLGPSGIDLRRRAQKHMASKEGKKRDEESEELRLLRKEKEEQAARIARLEEAMFARQVQIADQERNTQTALAVQVQPSQKKPGRPKVNLESTEIIENEKSS